MSQFQKSSWRHLWQYATYDEDEPQDGGLRPEDTGDEEGLLEDQDPEDDSSDFEPELDEDEEEIDFGEGDLEPGLEPGDDSAFGITEPDEVPPLIPGFAILHNENGSVDYLREFDSWWSFAQSAGDASARQWRLSNCASQKPDRESWAGTKDFAQALDMALRRGWPEGRKLLSESLVAIRPRPKVYESLEFEVAGAFPCVPMFCAGDPAFMISDPGASIRSAKPIVRIDYNHWVHAGVDINSMMLRGAAIVSLADTLERQGFSIELRIVGNSKEAYHGRKTFRYSIVYKLAGEPLDLDRAAFAIAHPASMRRLAFAIMEQHGELETSFKGNYGIPMYEANSTANESQNLDAMTILFVPGASARETAQSAQAAVTKAASALLDQLDRKEAA